MIRLHDVPVCPFVRDMFARRCYAAPAEDQLSFSRRRQSSGLTGTKPTVIRKLSKRRVSAHERTNASADAASTLPYIIITHLAARLHRTCCVTHAGARRIIGSWMRMRCGAGATATAAAAAPIRMRRDINTRNRQARRMNRSGIPPQSNQNFVENTNTQTHTHTYTRTHTHTHTLAPRQHATST